MGSGVLGFGRGKTVRGAKVLVTGVASGIGRATAVASATAGAELVLTDINAEGLEDTVRTIKEAGGTVLTARALDITDYDAVTAFATDVHANSAVSISS